MNEEKEKKKIEIEEKENKELQNELIKEQIKLLKEQNEFYRKAWASKIIFFTIGIIFMILITVIIASKH